MQLDIAKLATLNVIQRRVVYDSLGLGKLERHEAEEQVRRVIAKRAGSVRGRRDPVPR